MRSPSTTRHDSRPPASWATTQVLALALLAAPVWGQSQHLVSSTIASGGGTAVGTAHVLKGTAGQPAAGATVAAGAHRLTAGFWPGAARSAPTADLTLTKSDDVTTAIPGQALTYTLVVTNAGPASVAGARVLDDLPAELLGATWACNASPGASCAAAGSGSIDEAVDLSAGSSVTFELTATVDPAAKGSVVNTASVLAPVGVIDPDPTNDAASDTDTLAPSADLQITKQDGRSETAPGATVTYTIVARNAGPSHAPGVLVSDVLPAALATCTWSCSLTGGAACATPPSGDLSESVDLPPGAEVVYTATCLVAATASGLLKNTATIAPPPGVGDPTTSNNSATDSTLVVADLWLFADGFESGDTSAWTSASQQGLLTTEVEATDHYLSRSLFDASLLRRVERAAGGEEIFAGLGRDGERLFSVHLRGRAGSLELGLAVPAADGRTRLRWRSIHSEPRTLEVEWRRSLPGLDDGALFVAVDGDLVHWSVELSNHSQELRRIGTAQDRGRSLLRASPASSY